MLLNIIQCSGAACHVSCVRPSAPSQLLSVLSCPWLSGVTPGQFEDLVWPDFTCRPIYEQRGGAALYIHPSPALLDRPARCQTSASHELAMDLIWRGGDERGGGGWTEWVQPTCQAHWAVTVYHHCCLFQPWPLTPPPQLPAPHLSTLGRRAGEAAVHQRVSLSLKPWCLPTFCSTGRARRRAATVKCTIRRAWRPFFLLTSITPPTTTSGTLTL